MPAYDPAKLYAILMNTGLQQKDQPLYQVLHDLISTVVGVNTSVNTIVTSLAGTTTSSPSSSSRISQIINSFDDYSSDDWPIIPGNAGAIGQQGLQGSPGLDGIDAEDNIYNVPFTGTSAQIAGLTALGPIDINLLNLYNALIESSGGVPANGYQLAIQNSQVGGASRRVALLFRSDRGGTVGNSWFIGNDSLANGINDFFIYGGDSVQAYRLKLAVDGTWNFLSPLVLAAGSSIAGTAPLKLTSGVLLTAPEAGAIEFLANTFYVTDSAGVRHALTFADSPAVQGPINWDFDNTFDDFIYPPVAMNAAQSTGTGPVFAMQTSPSFLGTLNAVIIIATSGVTAGTLVNLNGTGSINFSGRVSFSSGGVGLLNITNTGQTIGAGFDVTTDAVLKVRTRAQTGDASLSCLNITTSGTEIDKSYNIAVPVTLGTVTMSANQQRQIINPAGTLAVLTVTLPPSPVDGQIAGISFTQAITSLTINAPGGATVIAPLTSAVIDTTIKFLYQASSTSWFPAS